MVEIGMSHRVGPETERLLHRAFALDDAEVYLKLRSDPDIIRYTGDQPLKSLGEAEEAIQTHRDFELFGYGRWACVLKDTGAVIGFAGLKYLTDLEEVDVGYRFLPEYWGRGLATEACIASLAFGFEQLRLDRIIGLVLPANIASARVLEKAGMTLEGDFLYDGLNALRFVKEATRQIAT